jgi:hypothetical protein
MNKRFIQRMALRATNTRVATDGTVDPSGTRVGVHLRAVLRRGGRQRRRFASITERGCKQEPFFTHASPTLHARPGALGDK